MKKTTYGVGEWCGSGSNFTVVDTPGFGDTGRFSIFFSLN